MKIERIESKCTGCMLCVLDCVYGVWRNREGIPTPAYPELCSLCSHCVSVCPAGAIRHSKLDDKQVNSINRKKLDANSFREIILSRRSVRNYKEKKVDRQILGKIISLARYSPTASNDQNVEYIVITERKIIQKISEMIYGFVNKWHSRSTKGIGKALLTLTGQSDNRYLRMMDYVNEETKSGRDFILHNAPALILVCGPAKSRFARDNCAIAASAIINYAHSLGLGTCFIGFLTMYLRFSKKLRKELGIEKNRSVYASLVIGYPAYQHSYTVSRKSPFIRWM